MIPCVAHLRIRRSEKVHFFERHPTGETEKPTVIERQIVSSVEGEAIDRAHFHLARASVR